MSFSIVKGYLLSKKDFNIFDEIITFITVDGIIFSCIALGTKKLLSKNARNLNYCSLLEFEFFSSRSVDKLSKLMRVKNIDSIQIEFYKQLPFLFINEVILLSKTNGIKIFNLYCKCLSFIHKLDSLLIVIYFLIKFLNALGIVLILNKCSVCGSKKIRNFSEFNNGFVCSKCDKNHFVVDKDILLIFYYCNVSNFDQVINIGYNYKKIAIKILLNLYYTKLGINLYNLLVMF